MNERPIIAVDAMGGDFGPSVVVPGAIEAARLHDLHVLLVGDTPTSPTCTSILSRPMMWCT